MDVGVDEAWEDVAPPATAQPLYVHHQAVDHCHPGWVDIPRDDLDQVALDSPSAHRVSFAPSYEKAFAFPVIRSVVVYPKQVLNQLKWGPERGLDRALVTYVHRGAPLDEMTILGSEIVELEHSFFCTTESKIPYHRIKRIVLDGGLLYDSSSKKGKVEGK